jgi:hypothetical protein
MPKPVSRSLGLLDGMILMAGFAVAALFTRLYLENNNDNFLERLDKTSPNLDYVRWILSESADFACLWLTALTPAAFFIRFRQPRPRLSKLSLQPGATALISVMMMTLIGALLTAVSVAIEGNGPWSYYYQTYLILLFPYAGASVAVVWTIQSLNRRCRPEAGGIDRIGRFLGICWIVTFVIGTMDKLIFGAWISQQQLRAKAVIESAEERVKGQKVLDDTQQKKYWEKLLGNSKSERSRIEELVKKGDVEEMKAELKKVIAGQEEREKDYKEHIEEIMNPAKPSGEETSSSKGPPSPLELTP